MIFHVTYTLAIVKIYIMASSIAQMEIIIFVYVYVFKLHLMDEKIWLIFFYLCDQRTDTYLQLQNAVTVTTFDIHTIKTHSKWIDNLNVDLKSPFA